MAAAAPVKKSTALTRQFVVRAHRDDESGGWWADSDDLPGLVTEAATYQELADRVIAVVPELCAANNVAIGSGDCVQIRREGGMLAMTDAQLDAALSQLGERMWNAMWSDDSVRDAVHELLTAKLKRDGVEDDDLDLSEYAIGAIFEADAQAPNVVRPKRFVEPKEWAKNSLYNLAAHWVLTEALARMRIEQSLPWDEVGKVDD